MTAQQVIDIKNSWKIIASLDAAIVGQLFYTRLFGTNPELRTLFKTPVPEQSKKLVVMMGFIINKLDEPHELKEDIKQLVKQHVRYGVKEIHYPPVGASLMWTLKKGLGDDWNKELEQAWTACYALLSSIMISSSREAAFI